MFPGREVDVKLFKLAVYKDGRHFDWHMDSTRNDKHHATLLVALNTSWEGGDLVLRRNGVQTHVDLRPQNSTTSGMMDVQAVALFNDTEYRVEPGIRIVLQFDVEIEKTQEGEDKGEGSEYEVEGSEDENEEEEKSYEPRMDRDGHGQGALFRAPENGRQRTSY